MSRFLLDHPNGNHVAYGLDHALGYFYDEWYLDDDGERVEVKEESTYFTSMNRGDFVELLDMAGAPRSHLIAASLDLPFMAVQDAVDAYPDSDMIDADWDEIAAPVGWKLQDGSVRGFSTLQR